MTALPIIIGMGGINAAGRTSFHQGFRRIVIDKLNAEARQETFVGLATLMNLLTSRDGKLVDVDGTVVEKSAVEGRFGAEILAGTLIRKIEHEHFDPDATPWQQKLTMDVGEQGISFETRARDLPSPLPRTWKITELAEKRVRVDIAGEIEVSHSSTRDNFLPALNLQVYTIVVISLGVYKRLFLALQTLFIPRVIAGIKSLIRLAQMKLVLIQHLFLVKLKQKVWVV